MRRPGTFTEPSGAESLTLNRGCPDPCYRPTAVQLPSNRRATLLLASPTTTQARMSVRPGGASPPRSVAIVGAGPGGLAAAMLLAAAGVRVTMFERLAAVGGRTRVVEADGFSFDIGATFFLYPEVLRGIFARC